jgi:hypothetical protein
MRQDFPRRQVFMARATKHTRIPDIPLIPSLLGARLDSFHEEPPDAFIVDYHELCLDGAPEMACEQGQVIERGRGWFLPRRIRFYGLLSLHCDGQYTHLASVPLDHPARSLRGMLSWVPAGERNLFSLFAHGSGESERLWVTARGCLAEGRPGPPIPSIFSRDWSPPPPFHSGLVPDLKQSRRTYGGDPVTIRLGNRIYRQRLFVGDIESQTPLRPMVDAVLNVGEEPNRWSVDSTAPCDRWVIYGEGPQGMSVAQITKEANWVIERLRKGQRVLVHCVAGLNRSTTVCCAVLILLEGLSAEDALERVRQRHAWARPDENHWLKLKWLAKLRTDGK